MRDSIAITTQAQYAGAVARYRAFCISRGWAGDGSIRADWAMEWFSALADGGQLASGSIAAYRSALSTAWVMETPVGSGARNPMDEPQVKRVIDGILASKAAREQERRLSKPHCQPLTFDVVKQLQPQYATHTGHFAALTLGVAAALRISELLGSAAHPDRALRLKQLQFFDATGQHRLQPSGSETPAQAQLTLHVTKTDQRRKGATKIVAAGLAVRALWSHHNERLREGAGPDDALFPDISAGALIKRLGRTLPLIGRGDMVPGLTGKCLRRGGASTLSALGASEADVQRLGWAAGSTVGSDVYANDPRVIRARAAAISKQMGLS
jgi:hypothetical protein